MDERSICLENGVIYTPTTVIHDGRVIVSGGKIRAVGARDAIQPPPGCETIDADARMILPGFIDLHAHGGGGGETMDATADSLMRMTAAHARHGTTSICVATMAASDASIEQALQAVADFAEGEPSGARVLGVHLEGPFLSEKRRGAHPASMLALPSVDKLRRYIDRSRGLIKLLTIAPELPGALETIMYAEASGIVASIGHTAANYQQTMGAISAGARSATHTYNAMEALTSREPGTVGALMCSDNVACEVIADGQHVHPAAIEVLIRAKGVSRVVLVTDCMRPLGAESLTSFELSGLRVLVREDGCFTEEGARGGSLLSMDLAVKNVNSLVGRSIREAVTMATLIPAQTLGISDRKGSLEPGKDADVVIADTDLNVSLTMVGGKVVYRI